MKQIWLIIGRAIYWAAWPFWFVYFKVSNHRSRILVICNDEVLLLKGWISSGKWALPGGGIKRDEPLEAAAIRELVEETGIEAPESSLRTLGEHTHIQHGLRYHAHYFVLELADKPFVRKRFPEIVDSNWFKLANLRGRMLNEDGAYALKQYMPIEQIQML